MQHASKKEEELLRNFGLLYSKELGIDLPSGRENEVFKWFLASIFFGKRISEGAAKKTFRVFMEKGYSTPEKIRKASWDRLVKALDEGSYTRYDFSTASTLLGIMEKLKEGYQDRVSTIHSLSKDSEDLERRLEDFKGIGPVTANIFLRELRGIWEKAEPKPQPLVKEAAKKLGISLGKGNVRLEVALLRLGKDYCRKGKCKECPLREVCRH